MSENVIYDTADILGKEIVPEIVKSVLQKEICREKRNLTGNNKAKKIAG